MNHGKINKKYYRGKKDTDDVRENNQVLQLAYNYFQGHRSRSSYMVAMKHHTAKLAHNLGFTLQEIAKIINVSHHTSVLYLLNDYKILLDHDTFIKKNYMNFMHDLLYPLQGRPNDEENKYILTHLSKIKIKINEKG